jgi:hypothetical protein
LALACKSSFASSRTPKVVDDTTVLAQLAKTIVKNYKDLPVLRYAYAEVKGAIRLSCAVNNECAGAGPGN